MTPPRLGLIAAVAANGVIGRAGQLPWHLPADLKHFKSLTMGHPVIMGRRTWESIRRPLPGRRMIVVSSSLENPPHAEVELARSLEEALRLTDESTESRFVIGGAALYAVAIPHAQVMHLTELDEAVDGDVFFPSWPRSEWRLAREVRHERDPCHSMAFRFCTYERVRAGELDMRHV